MNKKSYDNKSKTRVATNLIQKITKKKETIRILIVVPTDLLKEQWTGILTSLNVIFNCEIQVINTVVKHEWDCDLLIIDEIHRMAGEVFSKIFEKVKYKMILGLTATFERLDGKHELIAKYCPVCDEVNIAEAIVNNWVSQFTEYEVLIEVDLSKYKEYNRIFTEHFAFFNYNWGLVQSMLGKNGYKNKIKYRDEIYTGNDPVKKAQVLKTINYHAIGFFQAVQNRKKFINSHPKKLEIARKIINARSDKKIITFSKTVKMAEELWKTAPNKDIEFVYSGKDSKKKSRITIEEFSKLNKGVLCTCERANEGLDCPGLSVGIILGLDSSSIKANQRRGRVIRKESDKTAEIFNLILVDTVEQKWFSEAHKNDSIIKIDEENLYKILQGKPYEQYKKKLTNLSFRF